MLIILQRYTKRAHVMSVVAAKIGAPVNTKNARLVRVDKAERVTSKIMARA